MARNAVGVTVAATVIGAEGFCKLGHVLDPVNGTTTVADQAAVEAAVALLEADTTTPTQAHVVALRTVWDALVLDIAGVPPSSDVVLSYDITAVASRSVLRRAAAKLLQAVEATNDLTA